MGKKKPDMVVNDPGRMPYPTNVGAPAFTIPDVLAHKEERGYTATSFLKEQFNELKEKYFELIQLVEDTDLVYRANYSFIPIIGHTYHLYENKDQIFLSLISPTEWDKKYLGSFKYTPDCTWKRIDAND